MRLLVLSSVVSLASVCGGVARTHSAGDSLIDPPSDPVRPRAATISTATPRATVVPRAETPAPRETPADVSTAGQSATPATPSVGRASTRPSTPAARPTFANPVIDRDFPDPDVLRSGDFYYAYATNSGPANVQVARSTDLVHWSSLADVLPALPSWARAGRTWAPDVSATASGFVLYFVAWHAASGRECIGVATSARPEGPFGALGDPLICPLAAGGAIDPAAFVDVDGSRYLLWKNDGNCCGIATRLFLQHVSADGLVLSGDPVPLITADRDWEGGIVEAPTLWRQAGRYHLFYSANGYGGAGYAIGHAVADSVFGPYRKDDAPWLGSGPSVIGPGGQDVVRSADGQTWLAYHTWSAVGGYREMDLGRLTWEGGVPKLSPTRGPQPAP